MLFFGIYLIVLNIFILIFDGDYDILKNKDVLKELNCIK